MLSSCTGLLAQSPTPALKPKSKLSVGAYGAFTATQHTSKGNVYCCETGCGEFGDGTGSGPAFGILLEAPVMPMIEVGARIGYADRSGDLGFALNSKLIVLDPQADQYTNLTTNHFYTATVPQVIGELVGKLTPWEDFPIYLRAGGFIAFPLEGGSRYEQTDKIVSPSGITYPTTHRTDRPAGAGAINGLATSFGVQGGLGYPFPLSDVLSAAPEISYFLPLTEVKEDFAWKISAVQAGIVLRWNMLEEVPPPPPPPPPPSPKPAPVAKAEPMPPQPYVGLANDDTIKVVETTVTETFPILPYIFFDSASADISSRYDKQANRNFTESELPHTSLGAYSHILNIVGSRLANSNAKVTITGTTDGHEAGNSKSLAVARAEAVKSFLTSTWSIDPSRIKVVSSAAPTYPSSSNDQAGVEENRRVEIASEDENILKPIVHEKFKEFAITPKAMPFITSVRVFAPAKEWKFTVRAGSKELYSTSGSGEPPPSLLWKLDLAAAQNIASSIDRNADFKCELAVTDKDGVNGISTITLPVEKKIYPFELSRLSLVVFDFDKAEISSDNKKMVSTFVARTIREGSEVGITGTTDAMGELEHNKELSEDRAFAVHELIKKENAIAHVTEVKGIGPRTEPELNATPEARYYCRTVTVQVQTPLEK